jgi:hypothetical protein
MPSLQKSHHQRRNTLSRLQGPTITQYLIGGLFGNAPILLALFVVTFLDPSWVDLNRSISFSALMLGGAAVAAYFISIMVQRADMFRVVIVGVVTGSFCFIVNLAITIVFGIYFGLPFHPTLWPRSILITLGQLYSYLGHSWSIDQNKVPANT